jgi:hypothetical protein
MVSVCSVARMRRLLLVAISFALLLPVGSAWAEPDTSLQVEVQAIYSSGAPSRGFPVSNKVRRARDRDFAKAQRLWDVSASFRVGTPSEEYAGDELFSAYGDGGTPYERYGFGWLARTWLVPNPFGLAIGRDIWDQIKNDVVAGSYVRVLFRDRTYPYLATPVFQRSVPAQPDDIG